VSHIFVVFILLFGGLFGGLLMGMLGIGCGLISVPLLNVLLPALLGLPKDVVAHLALGTSLAVIATTGIRSVITHQKKSNVQWLVFKKIAPGVVIGALIGTTISELASGMFLRCLFVAAATVIAIQLFFDLKVSKECPPRRGWLWGVLSVLIGTLSSMIGIGGGTFIVPMLRRFGLAMRHAVGTSNAASLLMSAIAAVMYLKIDNEVVALMPAYTIGYVYLPAWVCLSVGSLLTVPWGASLATHLPADRLRQCFAVVLVISAVKMLI